MLFARTNKETCDSHTGGMWCLFPAAVTGSPQMGAYLMRHCAGQLHSVLSSAPHCAVWPSANCGEVSGTWKSTLCLGIPPYPPCPSDFWEFSSLLFALAGSLLSDLTSWTELFQGFLLCFLHRGFPLRILKGHFFHLNSHALSFVILFCNATTSRMRLRIFPCLGVGT